MQDDTQTIQKTAEELGISNLSLEEQEQLVAQFGEVALKAATIAVMEKLPEAKQEEFAALAEAGGGKPLQDFLNREVPEHETLAKAAVAEEAANFKAAVAAGRSAGADQ